jgi:hypothetical protein
MSTTRFTYKRGKGLPLSEEELIADLKRVAALLAQNTVSQPEYSVHGRYDMRNLSKRLGTWNQGLLRAGLTITNEVEYSDDRLFGNLLVVWQHFGRQPTRRELAAPPSEISQSPYQRRFGSWSSALEAFVEWANSAEEVAAPQGPLESTSARAPTPRDPSLRLRFKVLARDRFTCCACGRSPATSPGVELHVDHITPWSKGGLTTIDNLRTLCSRCNMGKSNVVTNAG